MHLSVSSGHKKVCMHLVRLGKPKIDYQNVAQNKGPCTTLVKINFMGDKSMRTKYDDLSAGSAENIQCSTLADSRPIVGLGLHLLACATISVELFAG